MEEKNEKLLFEDTYNKLPYGIKIPVEAHEEEQQEGDFVSLLEFWAVVDSLNYRQASERWSKVYSIFNEELKEKFKERLPLFRQRCSDLTKDLLKHLDDFAIKEYDGFGLPKWTKFCYDAGFERPLSDDSLWYLGTFIVGCGKEAYESVLDNPLKISEFKDYREGFSYCFQD